MDKVKKVFFGGRPVGRPQPILGQNMPKLHTGFLKEFLSHGLKFEGLFLMARARD